MGSEEQSLEMSRGQGTSRQGSLRHVNNISTVTPLKGKGGVAFVVVQLLEIQRKKFSQFDQVSRDKVLSVVESFLWIFLAHKVGLNNNQRTKLSALGQKPKTEKEVSSLFQKKSLVNQGDSNVNIRDNSCFVFKHLADWNGFKESIDQMTKLLFENLLEDHYQDLTKFEIDAVLAKAMKSQLPVRPTWYSGCLFTGFLKNYIKNAIRREDLRFCYSLQKGSKQMWSPLGEFKKINSYKSHKKAFTTETRDLNEKMRMAITRTSQRIFKSLTGTKVNGTKFVPSLSACYEVSRENGGAKAFFDSDCLDLGERIFSQGDDKVKIGFLPAMMAEVSTFRSEQVKKTFETVMSQKRLTKPFFAGLTDTSDEEIIENGGSPSIEIFCPVNTLHRAVAIAEPGKFRMVTCGSGPIYTLFQADQGLMLELWKQDSLSTMNSVDLRSEMEERFRTFITKSLSFPDFIFEGGWEFASVDYKSATDLLKKRAQIAVFECLRGLPNYDLVMDSIREDAWITYPTEVDGTYCSWSNSQIGSFIELLHGRPRGEALKGMIACLWTIQDFCNSAKRGSAAMAGYRDGIRCETKDLKDSLRLVSRCLASEYLERAYSKGWGISRAWSDLVIRALSFFEGLELRVPIPQRATEGQMMGNPLSFGSLCTINTAVLSQSIDDWLSSPKMLKKFNAYEYLEGQNPKLLRKSVKSAMMNFAKVNGDDMLYYGPKELRGYFDINSKEVGFEYSVGKNYYNSNSAMMNSQLFTFRHESKHVFKMEGMIPVGISRPILLKEVVLNQYLNLRIVKGVSPKKGVSRASPISIASEMSKMIANCHWAINCLNYAMKNSDHNTYQVKGARFAPNWYLPVHLGGCGLDPALSSGPIKVTRQQKLAAALFFHDPKLALFAKQSIKIDYANGKSPTSILEGKFSDLLSRIGGEISMVPVEGPLNSFEDFGDSYKALQERISYIQYISTEGETDDEDPLKFFKKLYIPKLSKTRFRPMELESIFRFWNVRFIGVARSVLPALSALPIHKCQLDYELAKCVGSVRKQLQKEAQSEVYYQDNRPNAFYDQNCQEGTPEIGEERGESSKKGDLERL